MRRTWLLVVLGIMALGLAVAGAGTYRPWPLAVLHGDLYTLTGAQPENFSALAVGANLLLLLAVIALGLILNRVQWRTFPGLPKALVGYGLAVCLVAGGVFAYPGTKNYLTWALLVREAEAGTVVLLHRNAYYPEGSRWRGLVVTTKPVFAFEAEGNQWPRTLLKPEATTVIQAGAEEIEEYLRGFRECGVFAMPQEMDPRPSLDHAAFYVLVETRTRSKRSFVRVSDTGAQRILCSSSFFERSGADAREEVSVEAPFGVAGVVSCS